MHTSHRLTGFALATSSGCLWFLACTPFDESLLAWVAAVPMLLAIDRAPTLRTALLLGWWAGVVETAGGFYWLIDTVQRFTGMPWIMGALVCLLFSATRAVIFLLFTAVVCGLRQRAAARGRHLPMTLLAPLAMAVSEYLVPQLFPCGQWISQAWHPLVIQITELTGPWGVTALLMLVNGAIYDVAARAPGARRAALTAALLVAVALGGGALRMRQVDAESAAAPRLKVGLVQPNFAYSASGDFSPEEAVRQLTALQEQSRRLERAGAELVVWSEGSYPVVLPRELPADFPADSPAMIRRQIDIPVLIGASTVTEASGDAYNSAWLFDRDGRITGRYDKVRLLAFGEYVPGSDLLPWLGSLLPSGPGRFQAGAGPTLLPLRSAAGPVWQLGPLICYEDLLPGYVVRAGRLHPDLLVNLTSDQWFGARTEPSEHLALAVFSAIEVRVALVRAVNSGISALIDPVGRVLQQTYADDPYRNPRAADGMLVAAPRMAGGRTPYVRFGAWFIDAAMLALVFIAWRLKGSRQPTVAITR